jgi:serine/threonine protein kinase HipA of HipAB toxin-antitoxin module
MRSARFAKPDDLDRVLARSGTVTWRDEHEVAARRRDDHDLNEHLCLDAARRAGLTTARTAVSRFDDETAVVVTRYDRLERDDCIVRVHQEDLCQALSVPPDRKYEHLAEPVPLPSRHTARHARPGLAAPGVQHVRTPV